MANVLIIDDDRMTCDALMELVRNIGHTADFALSGTEGLDKAAGGSFDVVFLDVRLPDGNGLALLPRIKKGELPPEVIILTGLGDPDGAELAIRNGAWDYLQKPLSPKKILLPLQRVLKYRDVLRESSDPCADFKRCGIIGNSPAILRAMKRLASVARSNAGVLITGETGTGKELFARAVHENSQHAQGPFIIVDCASIPPNLLESTLFGHVKGAFTGADKSSGGLVLGADKGTLFLDEIGEMPLDLQKKLLRVLQEHRYRPVGGSQEVTSDFRLVAATHRDLDGMVETGEFRRDLLYRLGAMSIELPPLREREEDMEELANHLVKCICQKNSIPDKKLTCDFLEALRSYNWPGNVRELINTLENSVVGAFDMPELYTRHLPERMRIRMLQRSMAKEEAAPRSVSSARETFTQDALVALLHHPGPFPDYKTFRQDVLHIAEELYFGRLMERCTWDVKQACELSGLRKSRIYAQIKKYELDKE